MKTVNDSNIILTGIQRSGTTLSCHLLNKLPNVVALHEPMNVGKFCRMTASEEIIGYTQDFFTETRKSLIQEGVAFSKQDNGKVPDNPFADEVDSETGSRRNKVDDIPRLVKFDKAINDEFTLVLKHPAVFTGLLESLVKAFRVYAVVRNPLSVLRSWNSLNIPVSRGRLPMAECVDAHLKIALDGIEDRFDRQIFILSWCFEQYQKYLPGSSIIYYEELISSGGEVLEKMLPLHGVIDNELVSKNDNPVYDQELKEKLRSMLLQTTDDWGGWNFYTKDEVLRS